jgi:hypothetical protein
MNNNVKISVIENASGLLCKEISLDKKISHGAIYEAYIETVEVNPVIFAEGLKKLSNRSALIMGTTLPGVPTKIVCDKNVDFEFSISRSKKYFQFQDQCIMFFDFDYAHCQAYQELDMYKSFGLPVISSPLDAFELLASEFPELKHAPFVIKPSSSSKIWNKEKNEWHVDNRGFHGFCWVKKASHIKYAIDNIYKSLFVKYGWLYVTKAGSVLKRCPIDISVISPERICFAAPPICHDPLVSKANEYINVFNHDAECFDLSRISNQDPGSKKFIKKYNELMMLDTVKNAIMINKEKRLATSCANYSKRCNKALDASKNIIDIVLETKILPSDYVLPINEGVSVIEVYKNKDSYNGIYINDPVEPDYDDGRKVAYLSYYEENDEFRIYSHAHGGCWYKLMHQERLLCINNMSEYDVKEVCKSILSSDGNLYHKKTNGQDHVLHRLYNDKLYALDSSMAIKDYIYSKIKFTNYNRKKESIITNCPAKVSDLLLLEKGESYTREIKGIIDYPIYDLNWNISDYGYNDTTLLYVAKKNNYRIKDNLQYSDVIKYYENIIYPFSMYPFDSDISKSCLVAGLFGVVQRPVLTNQPGLLINAPGQGVGKGKIVSSLRKIALDSLSSCGFSSSEQELEKNIGSILKYGPCILGIDNVQDSINFGNNIISSIITERSFLVREFGTNKMIDTGLLNMMVMLTGNNITLTNDSMRRFLNCRIVSDGPDPYNKLFPFDPPAVCENKRHVIIESILNLMNLYKTRTNNGSGYYIKTGAGSFDDWNKLVRKPICWLAENYPELKLTDPWSSIESNSCNSVENQIISQFLISLKNYMNIENDCRMVRSAFHEIQGSRIADIYLMNNKKDSIVDMYSDNSEVSALFKSLADLLDFLKRDLNSLTSHKITTAIASIKDKIVKIDGASWSLKSRKKQNSSYYSIDIK